VLFTPYQISPTEWLPLALPFTQLTPPPLTPVIPTLSLSENNTSAFPAPGALLKLTTTLAAALYVAVFCCTNAIDPPPPPPPDVFTVKVAVAVPL
jgi:hypothetical protein